MRQKSISPYFSSFVSASAGTGKTKILIDRLLNLLLYNIKPNKILCLAFTKAAAAEILDRINQRLSKLCMCDRKTLFIELQNLGFDNITPEIEHKARILFTEFIDDTEPLNIQTIHSFCQKLLTKFPFEAGINLNFTLLDNNKIKSLIEQAKDVLLYSINDYPQLEESMKYLSWHIKEYSFEELLKEIISNREKLDNFFEKNDNLSLEINNNEDLEISRFLSSIPINQSHIDILNVGSKSDITRANNLTKFFKLPKDTQIMMVNDYLNCFLSKTGAALKSIITKKLALENPHLYEILISEQQRVLQFNKIYNDIKTKNLTQAFITLSYYIRIIYQDLKKQSNALDYDDLISLSIDLLSNSEYAEWIRYKLDGGIDHILIDEAQDNSPSQWSIITKISEEFFYDTEETKSLFIVGDAKQSIFRFQGADPSIFNSMNQYLPENVLRTQLNTSFRSGKKILQFVDNIFNQDHIKPLVCSIECNIQHLVSKNFEGNVEIWPLIIEPEIPIEESWQLPNNYISQKHQDADELLAIKIGKNIALWLENKKFIPSKNRNISPGDILILTRRRNNFIHILIKTLRQMNIPVTGLDRIKLLEHPAILDIIALSNFILCNEDDLNLAIVLKSPIFNLSENDLLSLCCNREQSLWNSLKEDSKYQNIVVFLESLSPNLLYNFYFELIESKGYREKFIKQFGTEINDVLDAFLDLVEDFENDNISNLQLFINFLNNTEMEIQRDLSQNNNKVRIMTVHGAKGLQAPIIILADTTSLPHNDDSVFWLNEKNLVWPGKAKYYSKDVLNIQANNTSQEYAEYLRLLYVALTRAEYEIIITGSSKTEKISDKTWYSICQNQL